MKKKNVLMNKRRENERRMKEGRTRKKNENGGHLEMQFRNEMKSKIGCSLNS